MEEPTASHLSPQQSSPGRGALRGPSPSPRGRQRLTFRVDDDVADGEGSSHLGSGGGRLRGPPVFERKRRRHKTVAWKYKKSIGLFASFVFISNQILASGLLSMPSLVRAAGPTSASLVIFVFCLLSSACALLLLKSMTLIEGNAAFSERGPLELIDQVLYKATGLNAQESPEGRGTKGWLSSRFSSLKDALFSSRLPSWTPSPVRLMLSLNRSSLSQVIAFMLYANSFLSASSAALLVSYCIDALLLRVLGWTVFIPMLPCGGETLAANLQQLSCNVGDLFAFAMWPLRELIVLIWKVQGALSSSGGDGPLYSGEALEDWSLRPQFSPFFFVTSPQQLEEIFSGVCTAACEGTAAATAAATTAAAAAGAAEVGAALTAAQNACIPCLNYIGVSLGYVLTAAAGLRLAASDLEDTMNLQFISFFAVVAAVLNVCAAALFRLSGSKWTWAFSSNAGDAASAAALANLPFDSPAVLTAPEILEAKARLASAHIRTDETTRGGLLPALHWIFGGFAARTAIPAMVDAFGFSSSLPSWANEVRDEVPISGTVWVSSLFSAFAFFLFGSLCATAFVGAAESTNALASLLHTSEGHLPLAVAAFICLFHIAALLPSIVLSQISSRYDLLNMALCVDKKSAFRTASTLPWLLYWLLTYQPFFAQPSSVLALGTGLVLNFLIPTLTFIYASFFSEQLKKAYQADFTSPAVPEDCGDEVVEGGPTHTDGGLQLNSQSSILLREASIKPLGSAVHHRGPGFAAVAGAVAGVGGARTREMQRQLHHWLEEFARRAPDSDVAQLLHRENEPLDSTEITGTGGTAGEAALTRATSNSFARRQGHQLDSVSSFTVGDCSPLRSGMSAVGGIPSENSQLLRGGSSPSLCGLPRTSPSGTATAAAGWCVAAEGAAASETAHVEVVTPEIVASLWSGRESSAQSLGLSVDNANNTASATGAFEETGTPPATLASGLSSDTCMNEDAEFEQPREASPVLERPGASFQRSRRRAPVIGRPQRHPDSIPEGGASPVQALSPPPVSPTNSVDVKNLTRASVDALGTSVFFKPDVSGGVEEPDGGASAVEKPQTVQHLGAAQSAALKGAGSPAAAEATGDLRQAREDRAPVEKLLPQTEQDTATSSAVFSQSEELDPSTGTTSSGSCGSRVDNISHAHGRTTERVRSGSPADVAAKAKSSPIAAPGSRTSLEPNRLEGESETSLARSTAPAVFVHSPKQHPRTVPVVVADNLTNDAVDGAVATTTRGGRSVDAAVEAAVTLDPMSTCALGNTRRRSRPKAVRSSRPRSPVAFILSEEQPAGRKCEKHPEDTPTASGEALAAEGAQGTEEIATMAVAETAKEEVADDTRRVASVTREAETVPQTAAEAAESSAETVTQTVASSPGAAAGEAAALVPILRTRKRVYTVCRTVVPPLPDIAGPEAGALPASRNSCRSSKAATEETLTQDIVQHQLQLKRREDQSQQRGLGYVVLSTAKLRGGTAKRRKEAGGLSETRVTLLPYLKSPRGERLLACLLLLVITLCAFVAVAADLVDAAYLTVSLLRQAWSLSCASAKHLSEWLFEATIELNQSAARATSNILVSVP
ncbi:hypothetical protein cyc_00041 [Cyclospora cayetanensis]|uniref:Transmembrane protein n=1 Tax=Cyclospora cayetanensis TaxID=88456 RepID=A0A1D3CSH7_9EIME|nr:hypothetical protein cyc_00041 [Cyclospora cayetanensis]